MKFSRACPTCGKELKYSYKGGMVRATKNSSVCGSCAKAGVKRTAETKRKISLARTGVKRTAETKRNISIGHGGTGTTMGKRPSEVQQAQNLCRKLANYRCAICGSTDRVVAHHTIWYCQAPDLGANMDNLICLCHTHHCIAHGWNETVKSDKE